MNGKSAPAIAYTSKADHYLYTNECRTFPGHFPLPDILLPLTQTINLTLSLILTPLTVILTLLTLP